MATEFIPVDAISAESLADAAQLSSLADETPEGRSIVVLAKEKYGLRGREVTEIGAHFIPFSAETRMSGCDLDGRKIRKGAADAIAAHVSELGGAVSSQIEGITHGISDSGGTPLVVSDGNKVLGVIHLKDVVKGGIKERFERFRAMTREMCSRSIASRVTSLPSCAVTALVWTEICAGKASGSMVCAGHRMAARSMALRNSRIFPGQE